MQRNVNDLGSDLRERHHFCDQLKVRDYSADPGGKLVAINDTGKFATNWPRSPEDPHPGRTVRVPVRGLVRADLHQSREHVRPLDMSTRRCPVVSARQKLWLEHEHPCRIAASRKLSGITGEAAQ